MLQSFLGGDCRDNGSDLPGTYPLPGWQGGGTGGGESFTFTNLSVITEGERKFCLGLTKLIPAVPQEETFGVSFISNECQTYMISRQKGENKTFPCPC